MFFHISYPIADLRAFVSNERLLVPAWPNPRESKDFIRSVGVVKPRIKGGIPGFAAEDFYADAHGAVKLEISKIADYLQLSHNQISLLFRRLYCTGGPVVHLDLGFKLRFHAENSNYSIDKILKSLLNSPIKIGSNKTILIHAGKFMAQHLLACSTKHGNSWDIKRVIPGSPVIVIEMHVDETPFDYSKPIEDNLLSQPHTGDLLSLIRLHGAIREIPVWLITPGQFSTTCDRRALRLTLIRLRAERQCLRAVLEAADTGKLKFESRTSGGDRLTSYLSKADRLFKGSVPEELKGITLPASYSDILIQALRADEIFRPGAVYNLASSFENIRPNIMRKLKGWSEADEKRIEMAKEIGSSIQTHTLEMVVNDNSVNVSNSTNTTVTSGKNNKVIIDIKVNTGKHDVDELLRKLLEDVNAAISKLPNDTAEIAKKCTESIVEEAHKKEPSRKWYDISAGGLKEAVSTITDIAPSLLSTLDAIAKVIFI